MSTAREWSLVVMHGEKLGKRVRLGGNPVTIGRDPASTLFLPGSLVSTRHATVTLGPDGPELVDNNSTNGTQVNGVPRQRALLQHGDRILIGGVTLQVFAGAPSGPAAAEIRDWLGLAQVAVGDTQKLRPQLPATLAERQLAALYWVCAWLTLDLDEAQATSHVLALLREAFSAVEAHYYAADRTRRHHAVEDGAKPSATFANYLAEIAQRKPEAVVLAGNEVWDLQPRLRPFNFLVCPLRAFGSAVAEAPFVVFVRPAEWEPFQPADRTLLNAVKEIWVLNQKRTREIVRLRGENQKLRAPMMLGQSARLQELRTQAARIASSHAPVLIRGETGSGKDVLAQFVHSQSPRASKPFVKVNCASLPAGVIESELFGHAKGAFTDAKTSREGRFKEADGGTLFLDEIGELPVELQAKLLRAVESGEFERMGSAGVVKVNVRVIAATNRNLSAQVKAGAFRQDLLHRLNVLSLTVPPLRERPDDLDEMVPAFAAACCEAEGRTVVTFDSEALAELKRQPWTGNVRQLRAIVQRCCLWASGSSVPVSLVRQQLQEYDDV